MDDATHARQKFAYDPNTGVLTYKHGRKAGMQAGRPDSGGYLRANLLNKRQRVHRLAWLIVYGEWPEIIDHINHDKTDNRIENLRSVTRLGNQRNRKISVNNTSGVNGVYWSDVRGRWVAHIKVLGTHKPLGTYRTKEEAMAARRDAEVKHGFHENHGRTA